MKRILLALLIILIIIAIVAVLTGSHPGVVIFFPLAAIFGPIMGIIYPFPLWQKIVYIAILIISGIGIVYGIKNRNKLTGQIIAFISIIIWSLLGFIGLGTAV